MKVGPLVACAPIHFILVVLLCGVLKSKFVFLLLSFVVFVPLEVS